MSKKFILAVKIISVLITVLCLYLLFKPSETAILLEKIEQEQYRNTQIQEQITMLESAKILSDEKLAIYKEAWSLAGEGEDIDIVVLDTQIIALAQAYDGEGKPYIESGNRTLFLQNNASEDLKDESQMFEDVGLNYGVDPDLLVCIAFADSGLGKQLATAYNYGNVNNNDRGDRVAFSNVMEGIVKMAETLNNSYLGSATTIGELSNGGRTALGLPACGNGAYCWATSPESWNINVISCLEDIKQTDIDETYKFRL